MNAIETAEEAAHKASPDPPYVVPAYELRRVLSLARARAEAFKLVYSPLPPQLTTPTEWKAHSGRKVELEELGAGETRCVVRTALGRLQCDGTEVRRGSTDQPRLALRPGQIIC